MIRRLAFLATMLCALTAAAPKKLRTAPEAPLPDVARVVLTTDVGAITLDLDGKHAPVTTRNFLRYVDQKRFDGVTFYRVMRLPWGTPPNGLIQAGPRGDPKRVLPPISHETTIATGILHKAGTISMARFAPGTANGDFTILLSELPSLDANPAGAGDNAGYAAFGHVVSGLEVVRRIYDAPLSATAGEGVLRGQIIAAPIKIVSARRGRIGPAATTPPTLVPTASPTM